jgi:hypothetical protein
MTIHHDETHTGRDEALPEAFGVELGFGIGSARFDLCAWTGDGQK